jgi:hypothetical protein
MTKVLLEREDYRFVEAGILEINGKPDLGHYLFKMKNSLGVDSKPCPGR